MDFLSIAASVIGIVGLAGGAVGYFAKARGDSIIAYQEKEIELGGIENTRLEKSLAAVTAERDSLKEQVDTLKDLAQGSPQLVKLTNEIKKLTTSFTSYAKRGSHGKRS